MSISPKKSNEQIVIFFAFTLIAFVVRAFLPFNPGLSNDELSALNRINFESFSELIKNGILVDGHPAGTQVLLYYYHKLTGNNFFLLRLPFYLASAFSVGLCFLLGTRMFSKSSGILSASWMLGLQYFVHYGQLSRPYALGLPFCLLLVYLIYKKRKQIRLRYAIMPGLALAACAYIHYFAFLSSVLACLLFFIFRKENRLLIVYTLCIACLLYLPHLSITHYQLFELGGIGGWLGEPNFGFFLSFVAFLFHYSIILGIAFLLCLAYIHHRSFSLNTMKPNIFLLSIFILSSLIGFLYSTNIAPVLQYSVLIFSSPFLVLALFGSHTNLGSKRDFFLGMSVGLLCIGSLVIERKHFILADLNAHKHIANEFSIYCKNINTAGIIHSDRSYLNFYNQDLAIYQNSKDSSHSFIDYLSTLPKRTAFVYLAKQERWKYLYAKEFFPDIKHNSRLIGAETYLLGKGSGKIEKAKLTRLLPHLQIDPDANIVPFKVALSNDSISMFDFVEMHLECPSIHADDIQLISRIKNKNGKQIDWRKQQASVYSKNKTKHILAYRLSDLIGERTVVGSSLELVIENQNKAAIHIENVGLRIVHGNPYYYGVLANYNYALP